MGTIAPLVFFVIVCIAYIIFNKAFFYLDIPWDTCIIVNKNNRDIIVIKKKMTHLYLNIFNAEMPRSLSSPPEPSKSII